MNVKDLLRSSVSNDGLSRPDWIKTQGRESKYLRLDKNENIDPKLNSIIMECFHSLEGRNLYGYPSLSKTYIKLAKHLSIEPKNLLFSHGSDGVIRSTFDAFISSGDCVLITSPTFMMYEVYAKIYSAKLIKVNYQFSENGPTLELDSLINSIKVNKPKLVCLPNPDSPTGTAFNKIDLELIISTCMTSNSIILIDEAYYPFYDISAISLINEYPNLIIARTFSKAWGLAGLRVGFALGGQDIISSLHKVRPMYESNSIAIAVLDMMIDKFDHVNDSVKRIQHGMDYFLDELKKDGFKVIKGFGNFSHVMFGSQENIIHNKLKNKVLYKQRIEHESLKGYSRFSAAPIEIMEKVIFLIRKK
jgi:histidinol-phosphate aminotransferase